jgi:hypothetical protein
LALFGRRPQERVEGFVMPASKNLHNFRTHAPQQAAYLFDHLVGDGEHGHLDAESEL